MRILGSIVLPPSTRMPVLDPQIAGRGAIGPQVVGDHPIWNEAIFLQKLAHQFQRSVLVSFGLDQHIEDFAFGVDGAPQIDHAARDFQIDFIQMPGGVGLGSASAQIRGDDRPEMVHLTSDRLIRDRNAAFRQQIFNTTETQGEPEIEPDRLLNDLGREPIPAADFLHFLGYRAVGRTASLKRVTMPSRSST